MRWERTTMAVLAGYLLGTLPSADLAARLATGGTVDLRSQGSLNPGGANVWKLIGPGWGRAVITADIAKGAVAAVVGRRLAEGTGSHAAATAAVVGHCFPVWNRFKGGKGVGPSVGQCLATFPAYFPLDITVAILTGTRRFRARARTATLTTSALWVAAGVLWWRRRWPNLWGPPPTAALPAASALSAAVIAYRFLAVPDPTLPPRSGG